jgi:hypothetical protein
MLLNHLQSRQQFKQMQRHLVQSDLSMTAPEREPLRPEHRAQQSPKRSCYYSQLTSQHCNALINQTVLDITSQPPGRQFCTSAKAISTTR